MKPATASAMKSSAGRVLGLIDPPLDDVLQINLDAALRRLGNLNPDVWPDSHRTDRRRIQTPLEWFGQCREGRAHDHPPENRSGGQAKPPIQSPTGQGHRATSGIGGSCLSSTAPGSPRADGQAHSFPLRAEVNVLLSNIPRDLKVAEAERIAAFLKSLCEDFKP